jgi:diacylglycerol kinase (ATP)
MLPFLESRARSFKHAFAGLWFVIRTQRNAWIHATASVLVVILAFWLALSPKDWALLIIAFTMVWIAEFINTALEAVVDLASKQEHHEMAKIGKDVGAAAVLIAAGSAALIGFLILGPPLWARIQMLVSGNP